MIPTRAGLRPGSGHRTVRDDDGAVLDVPAGWELLPPGDAALTRAVKAAGPSWAVEEKRGRKAFSRGIWAPAEHIREARADTEAQRADPTYQKKLEAGRRRRAEEQADYVLEFQAEVLLFLRFHPRHAAVAQALAERVTALATPVGSGTVARTERIPVERRAEAAVIAWMRHQTTAYDDMSVAPVKGARRELRRELAERSRGVLQRYRRGDEIDAACPLARALRDAPPAVTAPPPPPPRPLTPPVAPRAPTPAVVSRVTTLPAPSAAPLPPRPPATLPPRPAAPLPPRPLVPLPARAPAPLPPPARVATPLTGRAAAVVARLQAAAPPRPPESSPAPAPPRPPPPARVPAPPPRPPGAAARQTITRPSDAAPGEGAETEAPPSSAAPRTAHEEAQHALYLAVRDRLTKRR